MLKKSENHQGFRECYVAYLDVLGFKDLVQKATENKDHLSSVIRALNHTKNLMVSDTITHCKKGAVDIRLQIHAFSDHIIFFIPVETPIAWFLHKIVMLHDRLLDCGLLIRGAITKNKMFYDNRWGTETEKDSQEIYNAIHDDLPVAVGPGLIEAHVLEDKDAVYPRILVSRLLYKYLDAYREVDSLFPLVSPTKSSSSSLKVTDFIRRDFDGLYHLHLLHPDIRRDYNEQQKSEMSGNRSLTIRNYSAEVPYDDFVIKLKKVIIDKQHESIEKEDGEHIRKKINWLATVLVQPELDKLPFRLSD